MRIKHALQNFNIIKIKGISLEQLLIASLINCILILILFNSYDFIKKRLAIIEEKINTLYNQTVIDFFLRTNIKKSGYKGCISSMPLAQYSSINLSDKEYILPKAPLAVCKVAITDCSNFVNNKILHKIINNTIKPNTDLLVIYDIPKQVTFLTKDLSSVNSKLQVLSQDNNWNIGDPMIIADCNHIQRFAISNVFGSYLEHNKPYNITNDFIKNFKQGAEVFKTQHLAFYIAKNTAYTNDVFSLYMDDLSSIERHTRAEAIVDHVEDLSIQVLDPNVSLDYINASDLGWVFSKYLLIHITFKNRDNKIIKKTFTTGIEVLNASL